MKKIFKTIQKKHILNICLFSIAILCFIFTCLFKFGPTNIYALSEPSSNIYDNNVRKSPYRNMTVVTTGMRNASTIYFDLGNNLGYTKNPFLYLNYGGATHTNDGHRRSSKDTYLLDSYKTLRGGVITTFDGIINSDIVASNRYYDASNQYAITQNFNPTNNRLELNAYNTSSVYFTYDRPTVLYVNDLITNFDLNIGFYNNYVVSTNSNLTPTRYAQQNELDDYKMGNANYGDLRPGTNYYDGFSAYINYDALRDTWQELGSYFTNQLNQNIYINVDISFSGVNHKGNTNNYTKHYRKYCPITLVNGAYEGRVSTDINDSIQDFFGTELVMRDYCVLLETFNINLTAYCDNGTYEDTTDDFEISVGNMFVDIPLYNTNGTIDTNTIFLAEKNATKKFVTGQFWHDYESTFTDFFTKFFDIQVIPGVSLSEIALIGFGIIIIITFIRMFR